MLLILCKALFSPFAETSRDSSHPTTSSSAMISDDDLYTLAIFLGSLAMLLIVLYHFLEVNAINDGLVQSEDKASSKATSSHAQARVPAKS